MGSRSWFWWTTEGTGYLRWVNARMRGPHYNSPCSGPWQWGGVVHKQSAVRPWLILVSIAEEGCQQTGGALISDAHRSCPWKSEPTFRASAMLLLNVTFATFFFLFTCPSLQLKRRPKTIQWVAKEEWKSKIENVVKTWAFPLNSSSPLCTFLRWWQTWTKGEKKAALNWLTKWSFVHKN